MKRLTHLFSFALSALGIVLLLFGGTLAPSSALAIYTTAGCSMNGCKPIGASCGGGCSGSTACGCNNNLSSSCNCNQWY